MSALTDTLTQISHYLYHNPSYGALAAFCMAFLESLAIVGSIIPGSITMTAIGVLIGSGILPFKLTVLITILGALVGDYLSYYLGIRYKHTIRNWKWMKPRQHWFAQGEAFFERYGIASIILGRFIGPMRSMMPMIAGVLDMSWPRFAFAIFPSAFFWSVFYLLPGIILGALSLDMPKTFSSDFLSCLFTTALLLLFFHGLYHHYKPLWQRAYQHRLNTWAARLSNGLFSTKANAKACMHYALIALLSILIFTAVAAIMTYYPPMQVLNRYIYHFMQSTHLDWLNHLMLIITLIADKYTLAFFAAMVALFALMQKNLRFAVYIFLQTTASAGCIHIVKHLFHVARPDKVISVLGHTSFPSGHTSFFTMFIVTIYTLHRFHRPHNTVRFLWVGLSIATIGLTRLYCGAHWLTDILGGASIGFALAHAGMALYTYRPIQHWPKHLGKAAIVALLIAHVTLCTLHKERNFHLFFEPEPIKTIKHKNWISLKSPFEARRYNRLYQPTDRLNVHWAAFSDTTIEQTLAHNGWHVEAHPEHWYKRIALMMHYPEMRFLSLLSHLYEGSSPAVIASKIEQQRLVVLEIWPTSYQLKEDHKPLWVGTLYWYAIDSKEDEPFHIIKEKHYSTQALQKLESSQIKYHNIYIESNPTKGG